MSKTTNRVVVLIMAAALGLLASDIGVWAAPRKPASKSTSKKTGGSKRASSGAKKSSARAGGKGNARARAGGRGNARARSSGRGRAATEADAAAAGTGARAGSANADRTCRIEYSNCMDLQIAPFISKYPYLADDAAQKDLTNGPDPMRCMYYDDEYVNNLFSTTNLKKYCTPQKAAAATQKKTTATVENFCAPQRDVNDLYLSYNYYCTLGAPELNSKGVPMQRCTMPSSAKNTFATKQAYAYYKEADRRIEDGELKVINFEQTSLFQNKIKSILTDCKIEGEASKTAQAYNEDCAKEAMNTWQKFSLSGTDVSGNIKYMDSSGKTVIAKLGNDGGVSSYHYEADESPFTGNAANLKPINVTDDLLNDLGLANNQEIFSINVAPPSTAGSIEPSGLFQRASDLCFSGAKLGDNEKKLFGSKVMDQLQAHVQNLKRCGDQVASRPDLERYYLTGAWADPCEEGYSFNEVSNKCVNNDNRMDSKPPLTMADVDTSDDSAASAFQSLRLAQSNFMSAKKSCDQYERTLIASRNSMYGKFDTALKNYIEDNVAKIIARKTKDQQKTADALLSVPEAIARISVQRRKMNLDVYKMKNQAMIDIMKADIDVDNQRNELTLAQLETLKQRTSVLSKQFAGAINSACLAKVRAAMLDVCADPKFPDLPWSGCGATDVTKFMNAKPGMTSQIAVAVAEQSVYVNSKTGDVRTKKEDGMVVNNIDDKSITGIIDGYDRIYCVDTPDFENATAAPLKADVSALYDYYFQYSCGGNSGALSIGGKVVDMSKEALKEAYDYKYTQEEKDGTQTCTTKTNSGFFGIGATSSQNCKDNYKTVERTATGVLTYRYQKSFVKQDGKCYNLFITDEDITQSRANSDEAQVKSKMAKSREEPARDMLTEHIGRGAEVFDTLFMPTLRQSFSGAAAASSAPAADK